MACTFLISTQPALREEIECFPEKKTGCCDDFHSQLLESGNRLASHSASYDYVDVELLDVCGKLASSAMFPAQGVEIRFLFNDDVCFI